MKEVKDSKKVWRTILRWAGWFFVSFTFLFIISILLLRLPAVQNKITQKVISFLKGKIGTEVRLESIYVSFPKKIVLKGLYIEDQSRDTLLYAADLRMDTDLWSLSQHQIQINTIELNHVRAFIKREAADTTFNFSYIEKAFAGNTDKNVMKDYSATPWEFTLRDVSILRTFISYTDNHEGNDARVKIGEMIVTMDDFDITRSIYKVTSVELANTQVDLSQKKFTPANNINDSVSATPDLSIQNIELTNIKANYTNTSSGQQASLNLDHFILETNEMNLNKKVIDINTVELKKSFISYQLNPTAELPGNHAPNTEATFTGINIPWHIKINNVVLRDNSIQYDNANEPRTNDPIDFNHLSITDLQLSAKHLEGNGNALKANLNNLSFQEKGGLDLKSFSTNLEMNDTHLDVRSFNIELGNSTIEMKGKASFPSLAQYKDAIVNIAVNQTAITIRDLLFFSPNLLDSLPLHLPADTKVIAKTNLTGALKNLTIEKLHLTTLSNTILTCEGNIKGLPDLKHSSWRIDLHTFYTTAPDITSVLADSVLPASIQIPEWIQLKGNFAGAGSVININGVLTSNDGDLKANGEIDLTSPTTYDATIKTSQLHLGKILKQPETMGRLSMTAVIKGSGLTIDTLNTTLALKVDSFQYLKYTYKAFTLEGQLNKYLFSGIASLPDENLDFIMKGDLDYREDVPLYKFSLALKNADLQKLNLSERPLKVRGTLDVNLATQDFKIINGNIAIRNVAIFNGKSLYKVDSLLFVSIDQEGESSMQIQSDIISGEFKGTFNLFSLAGVMKQHFNHYFSLQDETIATFKTPQQFKFDLTLKNTDLITEILIPNLEPFIPGKIKGEFNSETRKLDIEIGIARITYTSTSLDSISIRLTSDEEALHYKVRLKNIKLDTLTIDAAQLTGKIENDSILTAFQILNSKNEKKYVFGGIIKSNQDKFRFQFQRDQIVLNYTEWIIPADNYLEFSLQGMQAHNFILTGGEEQIALVTTVKDSTIAIEFTNVQLSSLTRIVRGVMPANGKLNGDLKFTTSAEGRFRSQLLINKLEILEQPFGDLTLNLTHSNQRYTIDLLIRDDNSTVKANGYYAPDETKSQFNINVSFTPLNLQWLGPLSLGQLRNIKGQANGNLEISGNFQEPSIRGKVNFENASFTLTYLKSSFFLTDETISFEESGIAFNNFTIHDSKKNTAVIEGNILTRSYKEFRFNTRITAKNFLLFNTTEDDNKLYYGKVRLTMQATIRGNSARPKVDVVASLGDDSELTYVVPQAQKSVMEQKGIVQFISRNEKPDPFITEINPDDTITSTFDGIDLSAKLELNDNETLNIVIDPLTGDKLSVKGNANLTLDIDPSGNVNLSGQYKITEGKYSFYFYKLVKREFDIEKGGTIVWSGNPLTAVLDIRAQYYVETSPLDLIANQINTTDQASRNTYRQRLPFLVLLDIKGQLLLPQITFKIDMPIDKRDAFGGAIYAKLTDLNSRESDVNKQVFALLILKRFVSDNPLESEAGSDVANTTRTSVSRLLSDQLNRLSENVKGVQLDVDIKSYEDYSTGEAQGDTQVQLRVSQSLLNDRLVVKIAGNIDVEGETSSQESITDYIGDIALEYKLTSDGRFRITGFRMSNYDMINGEVIETGTGLIYIKDYNTLRELFKKNAKEN